jgi:hypothetical protein
MLSAVLHTDVAIDRSIQIMRAFSAVERIAEGLIIKIAEQFDACKHIAETAGLRGNQAVLAASTLETYGKRQGLFCTQRHEQEAYRWPTHSTTHVA